MKIRVCLLLAVGFLLPVAESHGRPPRAREVTARLLQVDHQNQRLVIAEAKRNKVLELKWRWRTQFVENERFSTDRALKEGEQVELWYRAPLFGEPFATKIVWSREAAGLAK